MEVLSFDLVDIVHFLLWIVVSCPRFYLIILIAHILALLVCGNPDCRLTVSLSFDAVVIIIVQCLCQSGLPVPTYWQLAEVPSKVAAIS